MRFGGKRGSDACARELMSDASPIESRQDERRSASG